MPTRRVLVTEEVLEALQDALLEDEKYVYSKHDKLPTLVLKTMREKQLVFHCDVQNP